jgi:hypothetical protein
VPAWPASPFDAEAALGHRLSSLRLALGADRVSVWFHEADTDLGVPFAQSVDEDGGTGNATLRVPLAVSRSPFLTALVRDRRRLTVEPGDRSP